MADIFKDIKNKKTLIIGVITLCVLIVASFYTSNVLDENNDRKQDSVHNESYVLKIGDTNVNADVADTPALRQRGLSGRKTLSEDQGMFFVFEQPGIYPFWMNEMNFPIDIIWIDENMNVADITRSATPSSFPQTFASKSPVPYVLEVQAGFSDRHGIEIWDQVELVPSAVPQ